MERVWPVPSSARGLVSAGRLRVSPLASSAVQLGAPTSCCEKGPSKYLKGKRLPSLRLYVLLLAGNKTNTKATTFNDTLNPNL